MNSYTKWFSIVVWIGILVNTLFWVPALFSPSSISQMLDMPPNLYNVWLRDAGMLLLALSLFNVAVARAPHKYQLFAWLVVVARVMGAAMWLEIWLFDVLDSAPAPEVFMTFFIGDFSFAIIKGVLLYLGLRKVNRAVPQT